MLHARQVILPVEARLLPAAVVRRQVARELAERVVFPTLHDRRKAMDGVGPVAARVVGVRRLVSARIDDADGKGGVWWRSQETTLKDVRIPHLRVIESVSEESERAKTRIVIEVPGNLRLVTAQRSGRPALRSQ